MRFWLLTLLTLNFSFLIISCGLDIEDPTPPSPPVWVQKSLPEEWPERGIDAHESGGIILEWLSNPEDQIEMYTLVRAELFTDNDSIGKYAIIDRVDAGSNNLYEYVDSQIELNTRFYYKLKASNTSGAVSDYSDSLSYSLLTSISPTGWSWMEPNGFNDTLASHRTLRWYYGYEIEMENYCITLLHYDGELITRQIMVPNEYIDPIDGWVIPRSINLEIGGRYKWRIDIGGRYVHGLETSGSESAWASFIYIE
jgi:hypothetical protein